MLPIATLRVTNQLTKITYFLHFFHLALLLKWLILAYLILNMHRTVVEIILVDMGALIKPAIFLCVFEAIIINIDRDPV